ncbi:hypothetical protein yinte0001_14670 [Yersinia intermedia ATCC 29909]|nr:hypothetical protein yinte0001_14670 [Yersinia intermedia ATCC 29909]
MPFNGHSPLQGFSVAASAMRYLPCRRSMVHKQPIAHGAAQKLPMGAIGPLPA